MYKACKYNELDEWFTNGYLYLFQVYQSGRGREELYYNFNKVICKHLEDPLPEICKKEI